MSLKKSGAGLKATLVIITGVMVALAIFLYFKISDFFPIGYVPVYIVVIAGVTALAMLGIRKKWSAILMICITALVSALLVYGMNFSSDLKKFLNVISPEKQVDVTTLQVAVLKDSSIQTLEDLAGEKLCYSATLEEEKLHKIESDIDSKVMGISYEKQSGMTGIAKALYDGDVSAIIMTSAYPSAISEMEGYKSFGDDIRVIYSVDVETIIEKADTKEGEDVDVFTLYLSGIDTFGDVMQTSRSDVNVIAVINTKTKHILLVNTPRDYYVPLPISDGEEDKLTHAGIYGVDCSIGTLEMLYNTNIDYYLRMNFSGFEKIIDTIGGIDVDSDYEFTSTLNSEYSYDKGMNHLNGEAALFFARERHAFLEGDNQRGRDHMAIIEATVKKLTNSPEILTNYQKILSTLEDSFQTSMPSGLIMKLVNSELSSSSDWTIDSYAVEGEGEKRTSFSEPYSYLYVTIPDEDTVEIAKEMIYKVQNEDVITVLESE